MGISKRAKDDRILKINKRYYQTLVERSLQNLVLRYWNRNCAPND